MMNAVRNSLFFIFLVCLLPACEFKCHVGKIEENKTAQRKGPIVQDGAILYNGIELEANKVKLSKAYLVFENGERVPNDNFVDFESPVKLLLLIDSGWTTENGKVWLGVSEKGISEDGETLLDKKDLFTGHEEGVAPEDAKILGLTYTIKLNPGSPPTSFKLFFKVWDKKGKGYIEGNFKLFSK